MINFDFDAGTIFVEQESVSVQVNEQDGHLHLNFPDGPILRPLTVLERMRHLNFAVSSRTGRASLSASVLDQSTVKPGIGDKKLYEAIALYMAGAGIHAPPIYESIFLVAQHTGWDPHSLLNCEAAQIDQLAASLKPDREKWHQLLILDDGEEIETYCDYLAASLLRRFDSASNSRAGGPNNFEPISSLSQTSDQGLPPPSSPVNGPEGNTRQQSTPVDRFGAAETTAGKDQGVAPYTHRGPLNTNPPEKVVVPTQAPTAEKKSVLEKKSEFQSGNQQQNIDAGRVGLDRKSVV